MKNTIVSIIMPTYNTPYKYLSEAIQSILNQTFKDFELIIIDDSSTEYNDPLDIKRIINEDKRIRLISNQRSKGVAGALNTGLDNSCGKYIIRMDSDDISINTRLEEQVDFMEHNHEISILATYAKEFGISNRLLKSEKEDYSIKTAFMFQSGLVHPTICIRSDILNKYGLRYNENVKNEDYDLWTQCALIDKIKFATLPKVLLKYRTHKKQVTKTKSTEITRNGLDVRMNYIKSISDSSRIYKLDLFVNYVLLRLDNFSAVEIKKSECSIIDNVSNKFSKKVFWYYSSKKALRYLLRGKVTASYLWLYSIFKMYF